MRETKLANYKAKYIEGMRMSGEGEGETKKRSPDRCWEAIRAER